MQQDLKSELTKQLIIDKAFTLFYENGFKTTSIDKIMKETTLSKGAFYHHYKSKKALGLEVISLKVQKRVLDGMVYPLEETGDALDILEHIFITRLKSFKIYEKEHGCPMNNLINEIGDHELAYQLALKQIIETWKSALIKLIERGKREHTIKPNVSSAAVAVYLISAFEGIRGIRKLYKDDTILEEYVSGLSLYLKQLQA
ncbi:TetR/AcrR family transcriptional regulator [Formosa algae]|uniref:AcrR family transcriptional regulator n=1 Tax=Formosa algae TaxID=225843 RepID=A0A9X1CCU9_9FLAO|nr:TetR/AcrR family transcriptional regulator [Formosa algae]MBP1841502.1 AcrR family transcriptional regulator [Formosa algae]MDQ0336576.1 AcrR family transcriptional regulator [Formosa algae]OEI79821.1 TetR family transcriptional regulator [Formosa algae]